MLKWSCKCDLCCIYIEFMDNAWEMCFSISFIYRWLCLWEHQLLSDNQRVLKRYTNRWETPTQTGPDKLQGMREVARYKQLRTPATNIRWHEISWKPEFLRLPSLSLTFWCTFQIASNRRSNRKDCYLVVHWQMCKPHQGLEDNL